MTTNEKIIFISIIVFSVQSTRLAPLLLPTRVRNVFKNEELNEKINKFIFFALILYCYRDFSSSPEYFLRIGMGIFVFILQYYLKRTLLSIFLGTAIYMVIRNTLIGV